MLDLALQYSDMAEPKLSILQSLIERAPKGMGLEIGTRLGGSAHLALSLPNIETFISIDPYGSKPYIDSNGLAPYIYPDNWYMQTVSRLCSQALALEKKFISFKLTSLDFLDGTFDIWIDGKAFKPNELKFSYALLDGDHTSAVVNQEIEKVSKQMQEGGVLVLDNADWLKNTDLTGWETREFGMVFKVF